MKIVDWTDKHPDDPLRVILYTPAPDIVADDGHLMIGGEGTSTVVFDSTVSGDFPFDLCLKEITAINTGSDGVTELEYMPDDCWVHW